MCGVSSAGLKKKTQTMKELVKVVEQRQAEAKSDLEGLQIEQQSNLCIFPADSLESWHPETTPGAATSSIVLLLPALKKPA